MYKANLENINKAVDAIKDGEVIIYPTDTLYSFGVDASNNNAIKKLNKIKKRQAPLSILLESIYDIKKFAFINDKIFEKIKVILPGTFTILLESKQNPHISKLVQLNSNLIGIRITDNPFCNKLINTLQCPIITTSVNIHGEKPLIDIKIMKQKFKDIKIFEDKRKLDSKGSTILDLSNDDIKIVRQGEGKINEIFS